MANQSVINSIQILKSDWNKPRVAFHRGLEAPFKLCCKFNDGIQERLLVEFELHLPNCLFVFYQSCNGGFFFEDREYGQWGLRMLRINQVSSASEKFKEVRLRDWLEGDLIIGEFLGDSELLLLRCDKSNKDYGTVIVVSQIDHRAEWYIVEPDFETFLTNYVMSQGDKYWESN